MAKKLMSMVQHWSWTTQYTGYANSRSETDPSKPLIPPGMLHLQARLLYLYIARPTEEETKGLAIHRRVVGCS